LRQSGYGCIEHVKRGFGSMTRVVFALAGLIGVALMPDSASAQIFYKSPDFSGPPVTTLEPGFDQPMPGATPAEINAALVWNLRSALNIAALQCQFDATLRTVENYNAIIGDHKAELDGAYKQLNGYFARIKKNPKLGQNALDGFGTRTISAYSTVRGQLGFCETAGRIGRETLFTPKGGFFTLATNRLRQLRNSLKPAGEQAFSSALYMRFARPITVPDFRESCWSKKGYSASCGVSYIY
jgi:hypothetical protein